MEENEKGAPAAHETEDDRGEDLPHHSRDTGAIYEEEYLEEWDYTCDKTEELYSSPILDAYIARMNEIYGDKPGSNDKKDTADSTATEN